MAMQKKIAVRSGLSLLCNFIHNVSICCLKMIRQKPFRKPYLFMVDVKEILNINATPFKCGRVQLMMHEGLPSYHS